MRAETVQKTWFKTIVILYSYRFPDDIISFFLNNHCSQEARKHCHQIWSLSRNYFQKELPPSSSRHWKNASIRVYNEFVVSECWRTQIGYCNPHPVPTGKVCRIINVAAFFRHNICAVAISDRFQIIISNLSIYYLLERLQYIRCQPLHIYRRQMQ